MVSVPLGPSDWKRRVAQEPEVPVLNRYFEQNPTNLEGQSALLARPGMKRLITCGEGPIRSVYSQPGSFEDAAFIISGDELFRLDLDMTTTFCGDGIIGTSIFSSPSMTSTARIGDVPEYLYIADGVTLWVYTYDGPAFGTLNATDIDNNDVVEIGGIYYKFTNGSVDTGTPAGSIANPWLVALGASLINALDNLRVAINGDGIPGDQYSTDLEPHPTVISVTSNANELRVRARTNGNGGNSITTTVVLGEPDVEWEEATLTGGGTPGMWPVEVPDNLGVVSVAFIAGYVILVVTQGQGLNGRFYWINPGENTINALNFATAERSPDPIISVRAVGDQFWLLGTNSTEVWYPTGNADAPFLRTQGKVFDRGIWEGTDVQIEDVMVVIDPDGVVYSIAGGGPQRISNNSVEERIRNAIREQKTFFG